ncbi:MAG: hypothetical protein ACTSO7_15555, partial [Candidatus Heimdallarchaeota archaeon]
MILNNTFVKEIIKKNYDLGEIISIDPLESGHESDNAKVITEKGQYVIKCFSREPKNLREIIVQQNLLYSKGVKIPQPINTVTEDSIVVYSPTETIAIQSFIQGKAVADRFETPEKMFKLMNWFGKHLGEFHFLSKSITESEIKEKISRKDFFDLTSGLDWVKEQYSKADTQLPHHEKNEMVLKEFEIYLKEMD